MRNKSCGNDSKNCVAFRNAMCNGIAIGNPTFYLIRMYKENHFYCAKLIQNKSVDQGLTIFCNPPMLWDYIT